MKTIVTIFLLLAFVHVQAQPPFSYLGTFNSQGLPNYLETANQNVSDDFLSRISEAVPENMPVPDYHPSYLNNNYSANITLVQEADVFVTFVLEGAGYKNVLGYYQYPTQNPPQSIAQISEIKIIFPNVSRLNSGGQLLPGHTVKIGNFQAGTTIAFVLFANGFNSSTGKVGYGSWQHYSDKQFNSPVDPTLKQHSIVLFDDITKRHVICFEDITRPNGDKDFNDAVFFGTTNPPSATATNRVPGLPLVWVGNVSSDWNNPSNWNPNYVPDSTSSVSISSTAKNPPYISDNVVLNELIVEPGATVATSSDAQLEISGDYTSNSGTSANLIFNGDANQTIYGSGTLGDLTVNNEHKVTVVNPITIEGNITVSSGEFVTNDKVTIVSNSQANGMLLNEGGTINGRLTFRRTIPNKNGYHYLSSPISNATLNDIADDITLVSLGGNLNSIPFPNIYVYDETVQSLDNTQGWKVPANLNYPMTPGVGFAINMPGNTQIDFTGYPNDGEIKIPLSNTFSETLPSDWDRCPPDGWNLVGNPYPTALDWDKVQKNDPYQAGLHRWNPLRNQYATYINGVSTNGGSSKIASFQGFFVLTSTSDTLRFNNSHRSLDTSNVTPFYRQKNKSVFNFTFGNKDNLDEVAVYYDENATENYSPLLDIFKMLPNDSQTPYCYFSKNSLTFSILAVNPTFESQREISLTVYQPLNGETTFKVENMQWNDNTYYPFLLDTKLGKEIDLATTEYVTYLTKGEHADRFKIVFKPKLTTTHVNELEGNHWAYYQNGQIKFNATGVKAVRIFNMEGKMLHESFVQNNTSMDEIQLTNLESGIYLFQITDGTAYKTFKFSINE